jgi:hypothetical protein
MRDVISSIWARMSRGFESWLARMPRGPVFWLTLCGGLLVLAIFIGTIVMVDGFRERAIRNSERELQNTVMLLTHHFDEQFQDYEVLSKSLIEQLDISNISSAQEFKQRMSGFEQHLKLKAKVVPLSYIDGVNVYDADGRMINSSGSWPLPSINISARHYFQVFKSDPHAPGVLAEATTPDSGRLWSPTA